jgi:hypothetical protein
LLQTLVIELSNYKKLVLPFLIPIMLVFILFTSTFNIYHQQEEALAQVNDIIFKNYENSTYGILMQYPSDWKKVEPSQFSQTSNINIVVGFVSPKESASSRSPPTALSVGIQNLLNSQSITLDQYSNAQINFIKEHGSVLESNTITLKGDNNTLAHKIVYINSEGQKIMQVWTIKADKAYHITYATDETIYSDYLPAVQKMIDSFEIVITTEAAAPSDFNFAAAGDWGCTDDTTDTVNNIVKKNPELVLGLGDYSYEDSADCWFDIIQPIDNTMMKISIGNHDTEDLQNLINHFGLAEQYYSFDYQNVHFIALGTEEEYLDMSNDKAKEQLAFVKSDLEKASANPNIDWIIPFFHRFMYYDYQCNNIVDEYDHNLVDLYHPLFEKYGVNLVLHGHAHTYERTYPLRANPENSQEPIITNRDLSNYNNIDGLVIATVGTGGAKYTKICLIPDLAAAQYENLFGFLNMDVSSDGKTLVGTFYDNADGGEIKDRFTITKSSSVSTPTEDNDYDNQISEEENEEEEDSSGSSDDDSDEGDSD